MAERDIVCVSFIEWEGVYLKSTVKLMSLLAASRSVLFVEYAFTYKDVISHILGRKRIPISRVLGLRSRLRRLSTPENTQLWVWTPPPVPPYNFLKNDRLFHLFAKIGARRAGYGIRRMISHLDLRLPIVINAFNPFYGLYLIGKLKEGGTIYYCYDGIAGSRNGPRGAFVEKEFMKRIDGVICSSNALADEKSQSNSNCQVVKNGVDYEAFQSVIQNIKRIDHKPPVVSYIGSIDQRFDYQLIQKVVDLLPDFDFQFVGRVVNEKALEALKNYPNVHFHPPVPPLKVPELMFGSDVGMIPYTINEINKNVYPLKINEYLAVGTSVVMTPFADLPEFEGIISIAKDPVAFADALKEQAANNGEGKRKERMDFASKNSWNQRVIEFQQAIEDILKSMNK